MGKASITWKALINAPHIERILESMGAHTALWEDDYAAHKLIGTDRWMNANKVMRKQGRALSRKTEWNSTFSLVMKKMNVVFAKELAAMTPFDQMEVGVEYPGLDVQIGSHATYAIAALVAYDECAWMLDAEPEVIAALALQNDPAAVMLYPATLAFNKIKNSLVK